MKHTKSFEMGIRHQRPSLRSATVHGGEANFAQHDGCLTPAQPVHSGLKNWTLLLTALTFVMLTLTPPARAQLSGFGTSEEQRTNLISKELRAIGSEQAGEAREEAERSVYLRPTSGVLEAGVPDDGTGGKSPRESSLFAPLKARAQSMEEAALEEAALEQRLEGALIVEPSPEELERLNQAIQDGALNEMDYVQRQIDITANSAVGLDGAQIKLATMMAHMALQQEAEGKTAEELDDAWRGRSIALLEQIIDMYSLKIKPRIRENKIGDEKLDDLLGQYLTGVRVVLSQEYEAAKLLEDRYVEGQVSLQDYIKGRMLLRHELAQRLAGLRGDMRERLKDLVGGTEDWIERGEREYGDKFLQFIENF
ncbi:MAG: hypothetical protein JW937_02860 [Candidatus Omnitrophica bacterium]|nr:hypothetical protein [Candidatus Omnitrophota bacterium]